MTGREILHCWPVEGEFEESLNYLGTTVPNPNTNACVQLDFEIMQPSGPGLPQNKPIMFPTYDQVCVCLSVHIYVCMCVCLYKCACVYLSI